MSVSEASPEVLLSDLAVAIERCKWSLKSSEDIDARGAVCFLGAAGVELNAADAVFVDRVGVRNGVGVVGSFRSIFAVMTILKSYKIRVLMLLI